MSLFSIKNIYQNKNTELTDKKNYPMDFGLDQDLSSEPSEINLQVSFHFRQQCFHF